MLFGTINSTLNQLKLAGKWEAKKKSKRYLFGKLYYLEAK